MKQTQRLVLSFLLAALFIMSSNLVWAFHTVYDPKVDAELVKMMVADEIRNQALNQLRGVQNQMLGEFRASLPFNIRLGNVLPSAGYPATLEDLQQGNVGGLVRSEILKHLGRYVPYDQSEYDLLNVGHPQAGTVLMDLQNSNDAAAGVGSEVYAHTLKLSDELNTVARRPATTPGEKMDRNGQLLFGLSQLIALQTLNNVTQGNAAGYARAATMESKKSMIDWLDLRGRGLTPASTP